MAVFSGNGSVGSPSFTFSSDTNTGMFRPGADQLSLVTAATTRIFMDSDGKVAVGTSTPSSRTFTVLGSIGLVSGTTERFSIFSSSSPSPTYTVRAENFFLNLESSGTSQAGVIFSSGTTSATEYARVTSNGYFRMASGTGGIQFNGDTGSANALDDYEEGTWTPVYTAQTGSFATMTMNVQSARYVKVGNVVTVEAYVVTSNVDVTGASGLLYLSGLPFTSYTPALRRSGAFGYTATWTVYPTAWGLEENSSKIRLYSAVGPGVSTNVSDLQTGAGAFNILWFGATYIVN